MPAIVNCLWFDDRGEEAAAFYTSIFPNSSVKETVRYPANSPGPEGAVMTVSFVLDGQRFTALNGGPHFTFDEAISFEVHCETQKEIDYYWDALTEGGEEGVCGWLKDKFGVSWQIVPTFLDDLARQQDEDPAASERIMQAILGMKKLDLATLQQAATKR